MASVKDKKKAKFEIKDYTRAEEEIQQFGRAAEFIWIQERCTACNRCAMICPVEAIALHRDKQVVKRIGTAPCTRACPAGIDVPRYLRFIVNGKLPEAVAVNREKIPFPSVCGYVCLHPCESKCQRGELDASILIRALKRFAVEHDTGLWKQNLKEVPPTGKRVAVVGSGPAGLTTAYYLARCGHAVTVFEALPEPGGMMRVGIPDYRLPKDVLEAEIRDIESIGVEIRTNAGVKSLDELLEQGYDAVLLAIGAHHGVELPIPGVDLDGVLAGTSFLRDVNLKKEVEIGDKVVVLGGGSVAFDCARTALRLGARGVHMVCLEGRGEMVAVPEEIEEGMEEGVIIDPSCTFTRIVGDNGHISGVECLKIRSFGFDSEGRVRLDTIPGSEHILPADTVIFAVGQAPELGLIDGVSDIKTNQRRTVEVDSEKLATGKKGVFAAGEVVTGPVSIVEAIAAGRKAAISMDKYLGGSGNIDEVLAPPEETVTPLREAKGGWRVKIPKLPPGQRLKVFDVVELELREKVAIKEAERCLRCDLTYQLEDYNLDTSTCIFCGRCIESCLWDAVTPGYGYELAAKKRKEQEDLLEGRSRWWNRVLTILVLVIAVIILAIVISKVAAL